MKARIKKDNDGYYVGQVQMDCGQWSTVAACFTRFGCIYALKKYKKRRGKELYIEEIEI